MSISGASEVKTAMKTYVIDSEFCEGVRFERNCTQVPRWDTVRHREGFRFGAADWPMLRLVEIWNKLPGVTPVGKFANRSTALRRIWAAIQRCGSGGKNLGLTRHEHDQPALRRHACRDYGRYGGSARLCGADLRLDK